MNAPAMSLDDLHTLHPLARLAALAIAAGDHSALLVGPPGVGCTMLVRRIVALRPDLPPDLAGETQVIQQWSGRAPNLESRRPPFRAPHYTASLAGMIGTLASQRARPGETALAHRGLFFMDQWSEFPRSVREAVIHAHREGRTVLQSTRQYHSIPARFTLVATTTPCYCGWYRSKTNRCECPRSAVDRYCRAVVSPRFPFDMVIDLGALAEATSADFPRPEPGSADHAAAKILVARAREAFGLDTREPTPHTLVDTLTALGVRCPRYIAEILRGERIVECWKLAAQRSERSSEGVSRFA